MMKEREQRRTYYRKRTARMTLSKEERANHPVRIWRKEYELTQEQFGQLVGVSGTSVGYWERGINRTPDWVLDLVERPAEDYILKKMEVIRKK